MNKRSAEHPTPRPEGATDEQANDREAALLEQATTWANEQLQAPPNRLFSPRLELFTAPCWEADREGYVLHQCDLMGESFRLPFGALVLRLVYATQFNGVGPIEEVCEEFAIHPLVAVEGPERVREALKEHVADKRRKAARLLQDSLELESLLEEPFGVGWLAYWRVNEDARPLKQVR